MGRLFCRLPEVTALYAWRPYGWIDLNRKEKALCLDHLTRLWERQFKRHHQDKVNLSYTVNIFSPFLSFIEDTLAKNYYIITMRISNYAT